MAEVPSKSEWNAADLTNKRIDDIIRQIIDARHQLALSSWRLALMDLHLELYGFQDLSEADRRDKVLETINSLIHPTNSATILNETTKIKVYSILYNLNAELMMVFKKSGMQTKLAQYDDIDEAEF